MFRKRKKATVAAAADQGSWQVSQGVLDGQAIFTRFNTALVSVADRADYAFQIGVTVPLLDPAIAGLPQGPEFAQLDEIEGLIVQVAAGRAVLVGVITTQSMREFVLYSQESAWIAEFDEALQGIVDHHTMQVMGQPDPDWAAYSMFVRS